MNSIISSIVLLVSGIIISFLTSNVLFSIIGCSIVGLLLNRELFLSGGDEYSDPWIYPSEYFQGYQTYKEYVIVHDYHYSDYEDTVLDSVFIDTEGQIWSLGLESLDWYQLVDNEWIRKEPHYKMKRISESEFLEMGAPAYA